MFASTFGHVLARAAFARMAARGHGSIVQLSSMAGGVGLGGARLRRDEGVARGDGARLGAEYSASGVRRERDRPGPVYTPSPSGPEFITALGETTRCTRFTTRGDRRGRRLPRIPTSELHHRHTVAADGGRRAV